MGFGQANELTDLWLDYLHVVGLFCVHLFPYSCICSALILHEPLLLLPLAFFLDSVLCHLPDVLSSLGMHPRISPFHTTVPLTLHNFFCWIPLLGGFCTKDDGCNCSPLMVLEVADSDRWDSGRTSPVSSQSCSSEPCLPTSDSH